MHLEKISFRPTENLEFGFERTVIWGGEGHGPITLHTFLKSFFSLSSPTTERNSAANDPGARFGAFDFSYRLPFLRKWLTLYTDGEVHDDVSPDRRATSRGMASGPLLSHVPGVPKLDVRAEAVYTDPPVSTSDRRPLHVLGNHSEAGLHQQWPDLRRLDRPRSQGRTGDGSPGTSAATSGFRSA